MYSSSQTLLIYSVFCFLAQQQQMMSFQTRKIRNAMTRLKKAMTSRRKYWYQASLTAGLFIPILCGCLSKYSSHQTDLEVPYEGDLTLMKPVKWVLRCVHDEVGQPADRLGVLGVGEHLPHRGQQVVSFQAVPVLQHTHPVPHSLGHVGVLKMIIRSLDQTKLWPTWSPLIGMPTIGVLWQIVS